MNRYEALLDAVEEVRRGGRVDFVEPALRAGGSMVTESFLSPFRFNLGSSLVARPPLPALHVLEPDPLLDVGGELVRRGDAHPALALLLGVDPRSAVQPDNSDLVVVSGGNGLAVACLLDEIVAAGSSVREGVGGFERPEPATGLGIARLFVGLRTPAPELPAFARAYGFHDEQSLLEGLERLDQPLGFVVSNAHLDANLVDGRLGSFVWQGVLPFDAAVSRRAYAAAVYELVGVDPSDVVFELLWLPADTGEALR
jgi:hypothetical protein